MDYDSAPGPPTPVAGVKRKTPPPSSDNQSTHAPPGPPQPQSQSQPQDGNSAPNATQPNDSQPETEQSSSPPGDPGPQPWPMVGRESRPTLSAGLGGAPVLLSTPAHLVLPTIDAEALEAMVAPRKSTNAAAEAARKESSATSSLGSKKTIREIVATIDPRVRVDADVEDFMLEIADEFLDSVIHSACLIAQHRGSDGLDVRDLQLHLESNLNLRIPGFSSDETRVSISQSAMVGDVLLGAVGAKARVGTSSTSGGGATKSKGKGKEKGSSKDAAAAEREASLGRGLRASRIAAVRGSKKGS
ncbi:hypothetical protein DL93DRAFT_816209 [Clavulina sp. PMI_390]|nr:hypothetical protein DL93DRAFT_816209 [Clavulina sp. PMI_390]